MRRCKLEYLVTITAFAGLSGLLFGLLVVGLGMLLHKAMAWPMALFYAAGMALVGLLVGLIEVSRWPDA